MAKFCNDFECVNRKLTGECSVTACVKNYTYIPVITHFKYWQLSSDGDGIVCPYCGEDFCILTNETERFKCCPNCGKRLEGMEW